MLLFVMIMPLLLSANIGSHEAINVNDHETPTSITQDDLKKKKKKKKGSSSSVRSDRQIAVTLVNGFTSIAGIGLVGSYYVQPKLGVDVGLGVGIKGPRIGLRGRYMFTENNFAPYVGVGLIQAFASTKDLETFNTDTGELVIFDRKPTTLAQLVVGFEFMSNGGFVIGLNAGYALGLTSPIEVTSGTLAEIDEAVLRTTFGGGLVAELNIGYAF